MSFKNTTHDDFLGGRTVIEQPAEGYRSAMDPVLLAASVPDVAKGRVLDLGTGVGTALLCFGARVSGPDLVGCDISAGCLELAGRNAARNGMEARTKFMQFDVASIRDHVEHGSFTAVMMNPPYVRQGEGSQSPHESKNRSNLEAGAGLKSWISAAHYALVNKGTLSLIHRADRLDQIVSLLHGKFGHVEIIPLWPFAGVPAKRVIVRCRKGTRGPSVLAAGIVLHDTDKRYSQAATSILRDGAALE